MPIFSKSLCRMAAGSLVVYCCCADAQITAPARGGDGVTGAAGRSATTVFDPSDTSVRSSDNNTTGSDADRSTANTADAPADYPGGQSTLPEPLGNPSINNDEDLPALPVTDPAEAVALDFSDLDTDGNGEFTEAEREEQRTFREAKFKSMDTNHNGSVDQFEFEDFQHRKEEQLEAQTDSEL